MVPLIVKLPVLRFSSPVAVPSKEAALKLDEELALFSRKPLLLAKFSVRYKVAVAMSFVVKLKG